MTTYRAVVRHVRYWRGVVHRWSTVYHYSGTASGAVGDTQATAVLTADDGMCYGTGAADGGTYECQVYDQAVGGVPIATVTRFDWTNPGAWIRYSSAYWTTTGPGAEPAAEVALGGEWAAGLSKSGKPVLLRKWWHAVPISTAAGGTVDVDNADHTSLLTGMTALYNAMGSVGLLLSSGTGRFAGAATIQRYYQNHQMPRGRRRPPLLTAGGVYKGPVAKIPGDLTIE